jgi:hypothetical protein
MPCVAGQVCGPNSTGNPACGLGVCTSPCSNESCGGQLTCAPSGLCELVSCAEPGAVACPEHWRCDPAAAVNESASTVAGSTVLDYPSAGAAIARGCVRNRCDQEGGYACKELWECTPESAVDTSGCVPIPCEVTGHCSADYRYICNPTSTGPRDDDWDVHGCVSRNCEEGAECTSLGLAWAVGYCDPTAPDVDHIGCAFPMCGEGKPCYEGYHCDPSSPDAVILGCVAGADPPDPSPGDATGGDGHCVAR